MFPLFPGRRRVRIRPRIIRSPVRILSQSEWVLRDDLFVYRVTPMGFLHHMVRNLVGTFVQCGAGRLEPDSIPASRSTDRSVSGPTAPPGGLFLVSVEYPQTNSPETLALACLRKLTPASPSSPFSRRSIARSDGYTFTSNRFADGIWNAAHSRATIWRAAPG